MHLTNVMSPLFVHRISEFLNHKVESVDDQKDNLPCYRLNFKEIHKFIFHCNASITYYVFSEGRKSKKSST